jgi:phosphoribosyl-AMP cyclohydrolase
MPDPAYSPDFAKRGGLVPAVVQDAKTGEVLMLGWVNEEAWQRTRKTGLATFWSTSRNELWEKGATSGDGLRIVELRVDCDEDTVLYRVEPLGAGACHTKNGKGRSRASCFYRRVEADESLTNLDP